MGVAYRSYVGTVLTHTEQAAEKWIFLPSKSPFSAAC
jgi:hypothetical protein